MYSDSVYFIKILGVFVQAFSCQAFSVELWRAFALSLTQSIRLNRATSATRGVFTTSVFVAVVLARANIKNMGAVIFWGRVPYGVALVVVQGVVVFSQPCPAGVGAILDVVAFAYRRARYGVAPVEFCGHAFDHVFTFGDICLSVLLFLIMRRFLGDPAINNQDQFPALGRRRGRPDNL